MPIELHILKEELHRLNLLYDNAIMNNSPVAVIQKIKDRIDKLHELITERNKIIDRGLSPN
jgi:hypothetical protein